jgi:hypothetical protein
MSAPVIEIEQAGNDVVLPVRAQPRARKNGLVGVHDGRLKVAVSAAPEKGKANDAISKLLAAALGLKRSQVQLQSGKTSTEKKFLITAITTDELARRIAKCLAPDPPRAEGET